MAERVLELRDSESGLCGYLALHAETTQRLLVAAAAERVSPLSLALIGIAAQLSVSRRSPP